MTYGQIGFIQVSEVPNSNKTVSIGHSADQHICSYASFEPRLYRNINCPLIALCSRGKYSLLVLFALLESAKVGFRKEQVTFFPKVTR